MMLTAELWRELLEFGLLDGNETCALCRERPVVVLDVAQSPVLLCESHTRKVVEQLQKDLEELVRREG